MSKRSNLERTAGVRLTARDFAVVRLICEQGAVAGEDLGRFLAGRDASAPVSQRTRNALIARLADVGLVRPNRWCYRGSAALHPTRLGAKWVDWEGRVDAPGLGVMKHELSVAAVRLGAYPPEFGWVFQSERQIILDGVEHGIHRPDGIARLGGFRTAVEVQLSVPESQRASRVILSHLQQFASVDYWCAPAAQRALERITRQLLAPQDVPRMRVRALGGLER